MEQVQKGVLWVRVQEFSGAGAWKVCRVQDRGSRVKRQSAERASAGGFFLLCCAVALAGLAVSFSFEFLWGKKPCMLCNLQRSILALIGAAGAVGSVSEYKGTALSAIVALAVLNCVIAGFHAMVQLGWAADPCLVPRVATRDEFARMLESGRGCREAALFLFGYPVSGYCAVLCGCLAFCSGKGIVPILSNCSFFSAKPLSPS